MKFLRLSAPSTMLTGLQGLKPVQSNVGLQVTAGLTDRDRKTCSNIHHLESALYLRCISLKCGKGNRHRKRLWCCCAHRYIWMLSKPGFLNYFSLWSLKQNSERSQIFSENQCKAGPASKSKRKGFCIQRFLSRYLNFVWKWMDWMKWIWFEKKNSGIFR